MTIDPKFLEAVKEAVKLVGEAGERDTQAIVDELQVNSPDHFESLAAARGSGEHVEGMFHLALKAALDRKDLDDNAKDEVRAGAEEFLALFEIFREAPELSRLRGAIFEFAGIALLTGLQAGRSPVEVDRHHSKLSQGGKNSAAGREERWPWKPRAEALAKEAYERDPSLSDGKVASEIQVNWKLADPACPAHRSLEKLVSDMRKSGALPQRKQRRKRPQRSVSIRKWSS
jgi:hypothetical protein